MTIIIQKKEVSHHQGPFSAQSPWALSHIARMVDPAMLPSQQHILAIVVEQNAVQTTYVLALRGSSPSVSLHGAITFKSCLCPWC